MKIHFNEETDVLGVVVRDGKVVRTVEFEYGVADLDSDGEILAVELFGAKDLIEKAFDIAQHTSPDLPKALIKRVQAVLREVQEKLAAASR